MSKVNSLFNSKAIILEMKAKTKDEALKEIAKELKENNFITDENGFYNALVDREKQFSTGLGDGLGIPHAQSVFVQKDVVLIARSKNGIEWEAMDGKPVHVIFSIALNAKNASSQTDILADLSQIMMNKEQVDAVANAKTKDEILEKLTFKEEKIAVVKGDKKIVAVTACPTGIAHTYMSAQALKDAAAKLGYEIKVETQGRNVDNFLTEEEIKSADAVILAIDKGIDGMERFNGVKAIKTGTKVAIKGAGKLIEEALSGKGEIIRAKSSGSSSVSSDLSWGAFKNVYKNLMGGVSRMLPFVIAGGILLGLAFLFDSGITGGNLGVTRDISRWFAGLGKTAFGVFVPVLGAYVAYSIMGSEALLPGFVAGLIASGGGLLYGGAAESWSNLWGGLTPGVDQSVLSAGSGFIGSMIGGYLAAASVMVSRKYIFANVKPTFQGITSIIAIPVLTTLMTGAAMFVCQIPLAYFAYGLKRGLESVAEHDLLPLLGIIVGLMMAADMGGPINKAAYVFATSSLIADNTSAGWQTQEVMAMVMVAGMVPPIAIAFSTLVFKGSAWTKKDQEAGYANWLMGAFFITEGAIPYAAQDPKRVIPSIMVGAAITGALVGVFKVGVTAPHGGIFVFALLKSHLFDAEGTQIGLGIAFTLGAIAAGSLVGGTALGFWRRKDIKAGKLVLAK